MSHMACLPFYSVIGSHVHDGAPTIDDQPVGALRALHARRHARRHLRAALLQLRAPTSSVVTFMPSACIHDGLSVTLYPEP